jgi:DNA-binding NarL/FixJ family response regulator
MLTAVDDEATECTALFDGADDFVNKPFSMKVLVARIELALSKKKSSVNYELHFTDGEFEELTSREKAILGFITKGYTNKEIAGLACISEVTVGNHIQNIYQKLSVNNRTQAAIVALKYHLVE